MHYTPQRTEALLILEDGLKQRGYRVAPFRAWGQLSKEPRFTHGVAWLWPDEPPAPGLKRYHPEIHNIQINMYLGPPNKNEPTIYCFHIDHYTIGMDRLKQPIRRRLGFPYPAPYPDMGEWETQTKGPWDTELYTLEHELAGFARWLPEWVDALQHRRRPLPEPPYRLHQEKQVWFYTWSWAAMATYHAWSGVMDQKRHGQLPAGAN